MDTALLDLVAWFEPRAVWFVLILPPIIRVVGHWVPEELFMVSVGIVAARSDDLAGTGVLVAVLLGSQFVTDQATFAIGRTFGHRLQRFERIETKLRSVTTRLERTPLAVLGLVPARVFPLCRGAWLLGSGLTRIPWRLFAAVNALALLTHLVVWSGLGWWFADDLTALGRSTAQLKELGGAAAVTLTTALMLTVAWHGRKRWQACLVRVVQSGRGAGPGFRG